MKALILRLDAPLMSFGGVIVDQNGFIERFPGTSMLTGLMGNALGWFHSDTEQLQTLQERIDYAARWDVVPHHLVDYQTVDLGQPKMCKEGWTTRGVPEHRAGGTARQGTHQRYRHYWADGIMTLALTLSGSGPPSLDEIKATLQRPARPLFIGRKNCLPSRPLLDPDRPEVDADNLVEALQRVEPWSRPGRDSTPGGFEACWPTDLQEKGSGEIRRAYDLRDWSNQLPAGSQLRTEGLLKEIQS